MEAVKLVVVFLMVVLLQVMGAFSRPLSGEEQDPEWTADRWQRVPLERGLIMQLAEILNGSQDQSFHKLMGRSAGASRTVRLGRKREYFNAQTGNKGEAFVGLMGRRNVGDESEEWDM